VARAKKASSNASAGLQQALTAAIKAVKSLPESDDAWDHLEELAERLERPNETAEAYREVLTLKLDAATRKHLGQRALNFHEAWYGDDADVILELLSPFVDGSAEGSWALERLTRVLTLSEKWDPLLDVYDRALSQAQDADQRKKLLNDAAHVAKDFAEQPARAVDYLQQLLALDRGNQKLSSSIERLLERSGRFGDLIALWRGQAELASGEDARKLHLRIASCYLDRLSDPDNCLGGLRVLLEESPGNAEACQLLERVLGLEEAPLPTRLQAFALLRQHYDAARRPEDAVAAVEKAITLTEGAQRSDLHRDAGQRLTILKQDEAAMGHYAALLAADPADTDARRQLKRIADRSGLHAPLVEALLSAAEATADPAQRASLLVQAAELRRDHLTDAQGSIDLFQRVLSETDLSPHQAVSVAHDLAQLFIQTEQPAERLATLERLAQLESSDSARSVVLTVAADLAETLGEVDRALQAWRARLQAEPGDIEALNALSRLLERSERYDELVAALRQRIACNLPEPQRRADLMRIAQIQIDNLDNLDAGIGVLFEIVEDFGMDDAVLQALDAALSRAGRYGELADLMRRGLAEEHPRAARWLARLADITVAELGEPGRALGLYMQALGLEPTLQSARAGLTQLAQDESFARGALDALARAHREQQEWEALVALTGGRVATAQSDDERVELLRESARISESRLNQPEAALGALAEALYYAPANRSLEAELRRLGALCGDFEPVASAYERAAARAGDQPLLAARLAHGRGEVLARQIGDHERALSAYETAHGHLEGIAQSDPQSLSLADPSPRTVLHAVATSAAAVGNFGAACRAVVAASAERGVEEHELLSMLERETSSRDAWGAMCESFSAALGARGEELSASLIHGLNERLALWLFHRASDAAAAEGAVVRAVEADGMRRDTLLLACDIQRALESSGLIDSLLRLDTLDAASSGLSGGRNLDPLAEAAERSLAAGSEGAQAIVSSLYQTAARLWASDQQATGERNAATCATWAVDRLVSMDVEAGQVERAVQLLLDAAKLPLPPEDSRALRLRAGARLVERGQPERAVVVYQALLEESPSDLALVRKLGEQLEKLGRIPELLATLRRELGLNHEPERRLALRLYLSELVGRIEQDDGRVQILKDNLIQSPGHAETVNALWKLLRARRRERELAELMWEQSAALESSEQNEEAAALWGRVADLYEKVVDDRDRAIGANERAVALADSAVRVATLAKLYLAAGKPGEATAWLKRRLEYAEGGDRVPILVQLARAQLQAEQRDEAVSTLEAAFGEAPRNAEVRKLLIKQCRLRGDDEALARVLTRAAEHVTDGETVIAYAREAADLYRSKLDDQAQAIDVLVRARSFAPDDRGLGLMLGEALLAAERYDEARELFEALISTFGRRRSAERAGVHLGLARVLAAQEQIEAALDELDLAQKMDSSNPKVVRMLAELSRQAGQLERAERAYRALLLIVRDESAEQSVDEHIGAGEVLMQLSWIAADQGQEDQATERCESALEALVDDDSDARSVQEALLARGDLELLRRVLDLRLESIDDPYRRAEVLDDYARVLSEHLGQTTVAFERRLEAVEAHPAAPDYHDRAIAMASELDAMGRYEQLLEALLERTATAAQRYARCEVLLRLGHLAEGRDPERADALYAEAENTGVREVDVWRARAASAGARGDTERQIELLTKLSNLGEQQSEGETRADALYRLSEVQLAFENTAAEGLDSLTRALEEDPRYERAGRILERACAVESPDPDLLSLYERVARNSGDEALLLGFLQRQAGRSDVLPEEIREGVELAHKMRNQDLAEELMLRAVEVAADLPDGSGRVLWALLALADLRREQGDLAGAVKWLLEAGDEADPHDILDRGAALAELAAQPDGDLTLAAKLYEQLLERNPNAREAWQPLAKIYSGLGDHGRLERLVEETLDSLDSTEDRSELRLELARLLVTQSEDLERAEAMLREILVEDPRQDGAQELLLEVVAQRGNPEALVDLLEQHLSQAQARGDAQTVRSASLRLGDHLRKTGQRDEELDVYRDALSWDENDRELLQRLLDCLGDEAEPQERAQSLERLIASDEPGEAAVHAIEAADLFEQIDDRSAVLRVLEKACKVATTETSLMRRLEQAYRDAGDHSGLAQLLRDTAESVEAPDKRAALYREAAALYRGQLSQAEEAAVLLGRAAEAAPEDVGIAFELADICAVIGRPADAIDHCSRGIDRCKDPVARAGLLRLRAQCRGSVDDGEGALADLEAAFESSAEESAEALESALEERRRAAANAGDQDSERRHTLRLIEVLQMQHKMEQAKKALSEWVARATDDGDALQLMLQLCAADQDHLGVADVAGRLVLLTQGQEQLAAARTLAEASIAGGRPEAARAGLEFAYTAQPGVVELRDALKKIYEGAGAFAEVAQLVLDEAQQIDDPEEQAALLKQGGQMLLSAGETARALETLRGAMVATPDDMELHLLLTDGYIDAGELETANAVVDQAMAVLEGKRTVEVGHFCRRKARLAAAFNDRQTQLAWLVEATKYDKNDGYLAAEIADLAEELQDWDAAEKALRTISLLKTECPIGRSESFVRQARIWLLRGDQKRALMWARRAQKEEPESEQVVSLLEQLGAA